MIRHTINSSLQWSVLSLILLSLIINDHPDILYSLAASFPLTKFYTEQMFVLVRM